MNRLDLKFMALGAMMLVPGVALAIYMAIVHDFQLAPVHAHANLVGFVSMTLFGLAYRVLPELKGRRLAKLHFALSAPSAVAFPIGIYLAITAQQPLVAIVAALMWFVGAVLFFVQIAGIAFGREVAAPVFAAAE